MTRVPCPGFLGHAFWVDNYIQPQAISAKLDSLGTNSFVMTFQGLTGGAPASILIDSGASHCFVNSTFAKHHGFARHRLGHAEQPWARVWQARASACKQGAERTRSLVTKCKVIAHLQALQALWTLIDCC